MSTKPRLFINGYGVADVAYDPVDSVSVTADGVKTAFTLLNELYNLVDWSKVNVRSRIQYSDTSGTKFIIPYVGVASTGHFFIGDVFYGAGTLYIHIYRFAQNDCEYRGKTLSSTSTNDDYTSQVQPSGAKFEIFY